MTDRDREILALLPLLAAYLDGELSAEDRRRVEEALERSAELRALLAEWRAADDVLPEALPHTLPERSEKEWERLATRVERGLEGDAAGERSAWRRFLAGLTPGRLALGSAGAVVAALLVVLFYPQQSEYSQDVETPTIYDLDKGKLGPDGTVMRGEEVLLETESATEPESVPASDADAEVDAVADAASETEKPAAPTPLREFEKKREGTAEVGAIAGAAGLDEEIQARGGRTGEVRTVVDDVPVAAPLATSTRLETQPPLPLDPADADRGGIHLNLAEGAGREGDLAGGAVSPDPVEDWLAALSKGDSPSEVEGDESVAHDRRRAADRVMGYTAEDGADATWRAQEKAAEVASEAPTGDESLSAAARALAVARAERAAGRRETAREGFVLLTGDFPENDVREEAWFELLDLDLEDALAGSDPGLVLPVARDLDRFRVTFPHGERDLEALGRSAQAWTRLAELEPGAGHCGPARARLAEYRAALDEDAAYTPPFAELVRTLSRICPPLEADE